MQADALAVGKSVEDLRAENCPDYLIPHKTFTGNRPSLSILLPELDAFTVGQILALYEHRVAVQGFIWGINSFDQWGVELGKILASRIRQTMNSCRTKHHDVSRSDGYNYSTTRMLNRYLEGKAQLLYPRESRAAVRGPSAAYQTECPTSPVCRAPDGLPQGADR